MTEQRRIGFHWHLRRVMAAHNLWKSTEPRPLLRSRGINLSDAQVYRLVTGEPQRIPSLRCQHSLRERRTIRRNDRQAWRSSASASRLQSKHDRRSVATVMLACIPNATRTSSTRTGTSLARVVLCYK
jgi:Cro/C1-type HTH DNA-binding domain